MAPIIRHIGSTGRLGLVAVLFAGLGFAALAATGVHRVVSQRGRAFDPNTIVIQSGDVIEFMNDDGDLLHHAYLEAPTFSFDTGDQAPGSSTAVTFPVRGKFTVQCGIHPKMKLVVTVQ